MLEVLLTRAPDRPESGLLETDSGLWISCDKFFTLFTLEDIGFVRCESSFARRKLKDMIK